MNCEEVREHLADLVYSELADGVRPAVDKHLEECASCRKQLAILRHAQGMLEQAACQRDDELSEKVSVAGIQIHAMTELDRNRRRWQWLSLAMASALALMILVYVFSIRIEFHSSHVVMSWSANSRHEATPRPAENLDRLNTQLADQRIRLDDLDKTIQLLIQLTSADDRQRDREAMLFAKQIQSLRTQNDTRWRAISYVMGQLYPASDDLSSIPTKTLSGENP